MNNYIISRQYDGYKRKLYKKNCEYCKKDFYVPKNRWMKRRFCSRKCEAERRRNRISLTCSNPDCDNIFARTPSKMRLSRSGLHFCSRKCKELCQRIDVGILKIGHYKNGITIYRQKALEFYGEKCQDCGYNVDIRMLEVHHLDRNRENNRIDNLRVLCIWCHTFYTKKIPPHNWNGELV